MGELYFWRYKTGTRNYPGYHLSVDSDAAKSLSDRLQSRLAMRMDRPVKFELKKPNDQVLSVPNNRRHPAASKPALQISINFDAPDDRLQIVEEQNAIVLELSEASARAFLESVANLLLGENDYSMSGQDIENREQYIWFW